MSQRPITGEQKKELQGSDQRLARMRALVSVLSDASRAYYAEDREELSNLEYDRLYRELEQLEAETGITLANSPTVSVGYEAVDSLPRETHAQPMLSLDKTKDPEVLRTFIGTQKTLLSWKLDGLTIVLTYQNGSLSKAVTRGNGTIGEVVTNNARVFENLPLQIAHKGEVVLRGEAIITYQDFERINSEIEDVDAQYKNPRNLCSGSVRQLNNRITAERHVRFYAFSLVQAEGVSFENSHECEFRWLAEQGFDVVEYQVVTSQNLDEAIRTFSDKIKTNPFPSDGLVALYDDIAYGASLGTTAKFPRNAFAFKWADEIRTAELLEIEWSPSRTGLLNPVAIFTPVELEGTTVSRASVHNVSILKELQLGIGDELEVYKANMIIPQIAENLTRSNALTLPEHCPVCGGAAALRSSAEGVESLYCNNPVCPAKQMKSFTLFVSRDAMNLEGISESTLEKLMAHGLIHTYADLFRLKEAGETIVEIDGFGQTSFEKMVRNIETARHTTVSRLLYGIGIPDVGLATARLISRTFHEDLDAIRSADADTLCAIDGIGAVIAESFTEWWRNPVNCDTIDTLLPYLEFEQEFSDAGEQKLSNMTFVITGSLDYFPNRSALKQAIEQQGGKVAGSVSKKTAFLINNDVTSTSGKNKKAAELGIPILSEEDFIDRFGIGPQA